MASYPASIKSFSTKNNGDTIQNTHVNDIQDEVAAVETGLLNGLSHALVASTGFSSGSGTTASTASGVAVTLFAAVNTGASPNFYIVFANINGADAANYASYAFVVMDGNSARIVANNGTLLTLTLSTLNVQATQSSGAPSTINYKYLRIF